MNRTDRAAKIREAAARLFAQRRFHEVTTDDIARAAHVGKGTIYRYFKDKDDLFFHVATEGFDQLCDQVGALAQAQVAFEERLAASASDIGHYFAGRRQWLRTLLGPGRCGWARGPQRTRWIQDRGRLVDAVAQVLQRGVAEGVVRTDIPTTALARLFLGLLRTRAQEAKQDPANFDDVELTLRFFRQGAAPRDDGAEPHAMAVGEGEHAM